MLFVEKKGLAILRNIFEDVEMTCTTLCTHRLASFLFFSANLNFLTKTSKCWNTWEII